MPRSLFILISLTCVTLSLNLSAQVKDVDGKIVSEVVFNSKRGFEAIPVVTGRNLLFTRSVSVNGNALGVFAIDTGLNISMIDTEAARELQLSQDIPGLTTSVNDRRRFNFFKADSISIGRIQIKNHIFFAGNVKRKYYKFKEPVIGVIGCDILSKLPFTLDYQNFILTFYSREKFNPKGEALEMKVTNRLENLGKYSEANPNAGTPIIKAKLNKYLEVDLMVDTGEEDGIVLRSQTALKHKNLKDNYKVPRLFLKPGGSQNQYKAKINEVNAIGIDLKETGKSYILFPDNSSLILNNQFGNALLQQLKVTFDFENEKIWAEKFEGPPNYRKELDFAEQNEVARVVRTGNLEKAKELLKDKNKRTFLGFRNETLLMLAVESQNPEMVDLLLSISKHDVNMPNSSGITPLMRASATNQVMMINSLISSGAKVNVGDQDGMTSLHYAILGDSTASTATLIKHKASLEAKMNNGLRPISLAAGQGNLQIFSSLVEAGADMRHIDEQGRNLLHVASFGDNAALISEITKQKNSPEINAPDNSGLTPLMIAVKFLKFNAAKALLKSGASVKSMNTKNFKSALDYAYTSKNKEMVQLIEKAWEATQSSK